MNLQSIDEIKEDGLTVFMPSGIQATLFNEGENIRVKYYDLHEDNYSIEDFKELMTEGIFIFNDRPTSQVIESLQSKGFIRESLADKYKLTETLTVGTVFSDYNGDVHTVDDVVQDGNIIIYRCDTDAQGFYTEISDSNVSEILQDGDIEDEYQDTIWVTEYRITLKNGEEEWFENKESADDYFETHKDEVDSYISKDYDQDGNEGDVSIIYETDINEDIDLDELGGEALTAEDVEEDNKKIELELEIKDDKIEVEANIDKAEFKGELKAEDTTKEEPSDTLEEADENGENTLESFFGIKEEDFTNKTDLIKYIEDATDYQVISSDNLTLHIKNKNNDGDEVVIDLKHAMKEAFEQKDCPEGSVYKTLKGTKRSYITPEFKNELLSNLDKIAREFPDVKVRQDALSKLDDIGMQEYFDIKGIVSFVKKYIKILNHKVMDESMNEISDNTIRAVSKERSHQYIASGGMDKNALEKSKKFNRALIKRQENKYGAEYWNNFKVGDMVIYFEDDEVCTIEKIETGNKYPIITASTGKRNISGHGWEFIPMPVEEIEWTQEKPVAVVEEKLNETEETIVVKGQEVTLNISDVSKIDDETYRFIKRIELPDEDFDLECVYYAEQGLYDFKVLTLAPVEDEIDINKQNTYLSMDDKYTIKNLIQEAKKAFEKLDVTENLNEASNPIENIADALMQGAKQGFEPLEYGNWLCKTSLDTKWESFSPVLKDYILKQISYQVNVGDLEYNDYEISIDGDDCEKENLDSNDIESLGMFDAEEISEMINNEFKPLTFLISYNIEFDKKVGDKSESLKSKKSSKKSLKESKLKEEYGEYQGQLDEVASDIENGIVSGTTEIDEQEYSWNLTINGSDLRELDIKNSLVEEWIRHEIAFPVKDGHDYYNGLDTIFTLGESELEYFYLDDEKTAKSIIADFVKLGCDEDTLKDAIEYIKKNGDKDRSDCKEVEWWINYDINLVEIENDEEESETTTVHVTNVEWDADDAEDIKDLPTDFMISFEHYPNGDFDEEISDAISDKYGFTHLRFDWSMDENLKEQFKVKAKKKKKKIADALNEWVKADWHIVLKDGTEKVFDNQAESEKYFNQNFHKDNVKQYYMQSLDPETNKVIFKRDLYAEKINENKKGVGKMRKVNEDAYKVYNNIENKDCGTFNSWNDVQNFLNSEWGSYTASMAKENPKFTDEDKNNFFGNYSFDLVQLPCAVEEPTDCEPVADIENEVVDTDIQDAVDSPEYVEVAGVTADPEKAEVTDTLVFTNKEGEALNNLENGEKMLLPNEQPDSQAEYKNVGGATEIVKVADMDDISGTTDEIISDEDVNDIDEFINLLVGDDEETVCPNCGEEVCVCEKNECMQKLPNPKENKTQIDLKKEKKAKKCDVCGSEPCKCVNENLNEEEGIDAFEDEDKEYEFRTVRKNALANPNAYEGRYTQSDIRVARKAYADDIEAAKAQKQAKTDLQKTEDFKDGMLTDINDLDFPDAMHDAVDTKEDGSLLRLSDIAKTITDLKDMFTKELADFKNEMRTEIKTELADVKQDIKADVKDIQTDVVSKLDNTDSKIADLTSEEELDELEDEDLGLENEAPETEEEQAADDDELEEEQAKQEALTEEETRLMVKEYIKNNGAIYENIKNVIRGSKLPGKKMSIQNLASKLREDYGINTNVGAILENVSLICEYTPIRKYIIDEDMEKRMIKEQELGIANKFLKTGLDKVWAANREKQNFANLQSVLNAQNENVEDAKKAVDKYTTEGEAGKKKIKVAADLLTDNEQDKEEVIDYAINKMAESTPDSIMSKLRSTAYNSIMQNTGFDGIVMKNTPRKF